jgi:plastocyanin
MKKWFALLTSCIALVLVATGCGSDDNSDDNGGDNASTPAQPAAPSTGTAKSAVAVVMKNTRFVPMNIKVKKGGTITWTNKDPFAHTVTKGSGPGAKFDSGQVDGGGTFKQKFRTAGKIDYVCTIHPNQTGTITVE